MSETLSLTPEEVEIGLKKKKQRKEREDHLLDEEEEQKPKKQMKDRGSRGRLPAPGAGRRRGESTPAAGAPKAGCAG